MRAAVERSHGGFVCSRFVELDAAMCPRVLSVREDRFPLLLPERVIHLNGPQEAADDIGGDELQVAIAQLGELPETPRLAVARQLGQEPRLLQLSHETNDNS